MAFVHLHTHSHFSIGRAVPRVRDLVRRAAELGMPALALTDNNTIAGMGELAAAGEEMGVQPIVGCELDILPSYHGVYQGRTHRLTVLVENEQGYSNLVALITQAHKHPRDVPIHITLRDLFRHSDGLIVLTGSQRSELYYWLREGKATETKDYLNQLATGVGEANLFFEMIDYPHPRTRAVMDHIGELSDFLHIPAVVTQNVHFLDPQDMIAYCVLVQRPRLMAPQWPLPEDELPTRHFASEQELRKRFGFSPEMLEQTVVIAERCRFSFPRRYPRLPVPDFDRGQDAPTVLWDRAVRGAASRYGGLNQTVKERLNLEYTDICAGDDGRIDLTEYILMLQDVMQFVRESGLCRGVGRGRLLSSVIAYSLGIVEVDPLAHSIDYEPLRDHPLRLPVFPLDVSQQAADQVLEYLGEHYGKRCVVGVGRRIDWARQRLFHHLLRWAGLPQVPLRKYPPPRRAGAEADVESHDEDTDHEDGGGRFREEWDEDIETSAKGETSPANPIGNEGVPRDVNIRSERTIADVVYALHPCPRGFGTERGQFAVSKEPVDLNVPVIPSHSGQPISQADGALLDRLQMPRLQFSPHPLLNILEAAQQWIRQEENPDFSLTEIPAHDEATFQLLAMGLTNGIAPLHNISTKSLLRAERPRTLEELLELMARLGRRGIAERRTSATVDVLPDCILSYRAAYLKVHFPVSFMTGLLTHSLLSRTVPAVQRPHFQILLRETRQMGIEVLAPNINLSAYEFSQEGHKIRMGLMVVQQTGPKTFDEIARVRQQLSFSGLADFCHRTDPRSVSHTVVVNLVKAGAFDGLGEDRRRLLVDFERALKNARRRASQVAGAAADSQLQLFDPAMFQEPAVANPETKPTDTAGPTAAEIMRYEREAIGYPVSHDQLDYHEAVMRRMRAISPFEIIPRMEGRIVYVAGFIDHVEYDGPLVGETGGLVLDLEGHVVRVPPSLVSHVERVQSARSPVLVEGRVKQAPGGGDLVLVARAILLLEDVAQRASEVNYLRLDASGKSPEEIRELRALLRTYKGETLAEVEGVERTSWWRRKGSGGSYVFYCPPLHQGLREILGEDRIHLHDADGRRMQPPTRLPREKR